MSGTMRANGANIYYRFDGAAVVFDRRGADMEMEVDLPFREIRMTVDLETTAPDDAVEAMKSDLAKFCPVSKPIRQAGTTIAEEWRVTRPAEAGA